MKPHILFLVLLFTSLVFLTSCKDQGTTPPEPTIPEISDVELSAESIIVNDTVQLTVTLSTELEQEYKLRWQLTGYQTDTDSVTTETVFSWTAPRVHGNYEHSVQVVSSMGEPVSEPFLFTTEITSVPVVPEEGNKLVFSMPAGDGNSEIFTMNLDGSELTQLTTLGIHEAFEPSWSPDGKQIVFSTPYKSGFVGLALYLMNTDGTNMRPMKPTQDSTRAHPGSNPKWSPDGTKIAFTIYSEFNDNIFLYDFETDSVIQLTNHIADDQYPNWSPDSDKIVFSSKRDYYNADSMRYRSDLYTIDINEENLQRITETGFALRPNWQSGNKYISYEWSRNGNRVFYLDISSNQIHELNTNLEFEASPQWSESNELLFIHGRVDENTNSEVQVYDFSQNPPVMMERYQNIESYRLGRGFNWYHYEE